MTRSGARLWFRITWLWMGVLLLLTGLGMFLYGFGQHIHEATSNHNAPPMTSENSSWLTVAPYNGWIARGLFIGVAGFMGLTAMLEVDA